jgi:hypothetical protein
MSQFSERFIFDDDSTSGSSARLSSLQRNIWDDQQGLGTVPSALGSSSYLPRYLQMGGDDDDDTFPTMVCFNYCLFSAWLCRLKVNFCADTRLFIVYSSALHLRAHWTWVKFRTRRPV